MRNPISILFYALPLLAAAQDEAMNKALSFGAGPAWSNIRSPNVKTDPQALSNGHISPGIAVGYTRFFNKHFGFTTGVEFGQYRNTTRYQGYFKSAALQPDRFGYPHYPLSVANYSLVRTISSLDLPLCVRLNSSTDNNLVFFADIGLRLNLIIGDMMVKDGSLSLKGLYPQSVNTVFALVENEPFYGFTTVHYKSIRQQGGNKFGYGLVANLGASAAVNKRSFLSVSFNLFSGLSNVNVKTQTTYEDQLGREELLLPSRLLMLTMRVAYGFWVY